MVEKPDPDDNVINTVVNWAIDHVVVDANFEGTSLLVLGDAKLLASHASTATLLPEESWRIQNVPGGTFLVVRGVDPNSDGPWVWVLRADHGPISRIVVSPRLADPDSAATSETVGNLSCPSGRLAVGSPNAPSTATAASAPRELQNGAQFVVANEVSGPLRDGYIVLVDLPTVGECAVQVQAGKARGSVATFTIELPRPEWLPPDRPIISR